MKDHPTLTRVLYATTIVVFALGLLHILASLTLDGTT